MISFRSVSIKGAFNFGRARVLWNDGLLRVFCYDGLALEIKAQPPVKRIRHLATWDITTERGEITLRNKCITCGGRKWWPVYYMEQNDLWKMA